MNKSLIHIFLISILVVALINTQKAFLENKKEYMKFLDNENGFQDYDMYVFSLTWSNTFCLTLPDRESCQSKLNHIPIHQILRIHGLWPSLKSGVRLSDCNTGPEIKIRSLPVQEMSVVWPALKTEAEFSFYNHEYNKHGLCYVKKYKTPEIVSYFQKTIEVYQNHNFEKAISSVFPTITPGEEVSLTYAQLEKKFTDFFGGESFFQFACVKKNNKQYFSEVRFFLDLDFKRIDNYTTSDRSCNQGVDLTILFENPVQ